MESIGSHEAEAHLSQLLERVERGEHFTITRLGKPVARLVPAAPDPCRSDVLAALDAMRAFQRDEAPTLGDDLAVRDLRDEGRPI